MTQIIKENDHGVLWLTLNRPEFGNSLSHELIHELTAELESAQRDPHVRAVVLTGNGKLFCGGGDVKSWAAKKGTPEQNLADGQAFGAASKRLVIALYELDKPTIAMLNGAAAGAGLDLAAACDFRFARSGAKLVCSYTKVGFAPDVGGSWLYEKLMGPSKAKELIFTGDAWSAEEGLAAGLVDRVYTAEALRAETEAFARKLASGPTVAIAMTKKLMRGAARRSLAEQIDAEHDAARVCRESEDHKEGLAAANEKRSPQFTGR